MIRVSIVLSVAAILVVAILTVDAAMPVVDNVQANQRAGTTGAGTVVDITYDVEDADSDSADISIEMSNDGGTTFTVNATTFTGDVGRVEVGTGKAVEWQAGVDVPGEYWDNCQAKVTAEDIPSGPAGEIVVNLPGGATMTMVWIEPGTFTMGSPSSEPGRYSYEGPQHHVTITQGFYLGKYKITQGHWESVMGTRPWSGKSYVQENPAHPAVYVSWDDIQAFIAALNAAEGSDVYRLPTEAEWEYSCRAGTETRWSFGEDESELGQYAWYRDNAWNVGEKYAHAVGTKLPNPWGLYDMHGNVWEWVHDWYGSYTSGAETDPPGPSTGSNRVRRGGSFNSYARSVRSADRGSTWPASRDYGLGARLLRQGP